jgi:flagellar protein FliS
MFPAHSRAALNAYRNATVASIDGSATPHQLIVMLFNGARTAVAMASGHLQRNEIALKCKAISTAIEIIDGGLKASLDLSVGGELAQNLSDLYAYMAQQLFHANLRNDPKVLDEVAHLLEELGSAWEAIGAKPLAAAAPMHAAVAPPAAPSPASRVATAYGAR